MRLEARIDRNQFALRWNAAAALALATIANMFAKSAIKRRNRVRVLADTLAAVPTEHSHERYLGRPTAPLCVADAVGVPASQVAVSAVR